MHSTPVQSWHYPTNCPRMATGLVGIVSPAASQPPVSKMAPVPAMYTVLATITKQEAPKLDLFTAPLNVTLEFGKYTNPVMSQVGELPADETSTPVVSAGSW